MSMGTENILRQIQKSTKTRFEDAHRVMGFAEFMNYVTTCPEQMCRNSVTYIHDAIAHFGTETKQSPIQHGEERRFKVFNQEFVQNGVSVQGQENAQNEIMNILSSFVSIGKAEKAIILYGPNGSAKSSLIKSIFLGVEAYSQQEEGALFHFSWIFPHESLEKAALGIGSRERIEDSMESYAKLEQSRIGAILRSELHENPLFLIPKEDRKELFAQWMNSDISPQQKNKLRALEESFMNGALGHKNEMIFQALLDDYNGDFSKVMKHVRIERLYLSKRFRRGLVSIEPQFSIDANMRQVTLDRSLSNLPAALHSLNLFQLEGDLVDGNRGIVEYNDILKRPIEHFKYLLGTTESSTFNLGNVLVFLDTVFLATTNDRQLEAFRQHPEFYSFKARIEFIRVPYLLRWSDEERIYLKTAKDLSTQKELAPHTTRCIALWAVLTRLKRPQVQNKSAMLTKVLEKLSPLEKAYLYDSGTCPAHLSSEERTELKAHIPELFAEHSRLPHYEGLLGASARELKVALQIAAQNPKYPCVSALAMFSELRKLIERKNDFDYLRLEANHGYHDYPHLLDLVENEWLSWVDEDVKTCLDLSDQDKFLSVITDYIQQVTHNIRGEKIKNKITGKSEEPSQDSMRRFEATIQVSETEAPEFRQSIMGRLGAWKLENRDTPQGQPLPFEQIFSDLLRKMHNHFFEERRSVLQKIGDYLSETQDVLEDIKTHVPNTERESKTLARRALEGLQERFGYGPRAAQESLAELIKKRYR
jgi:serine protein kinase